MTKDSVSNGMAPDYGYETRKRILIVDDIRTDLHYMGKLIQGFGHETQLTESASSALELIDEKTDLIIADGIMPGMDGFDLVKSIRGNTSITHIPVIMVTSLSGRQDRIKAVEVGVNDFVTKPVDKVELKVRVDSMLKMKEAQDRVRKYQKELEHLVEKKTWDLNSALHKLQAVLNGMSDCMVTLDPQLDVVEANQAFLKMCGRSHEALKGVSFIDLLPGEKQKEEFNLLFSRSGAVSENEMEFPQWGRRIFSVLATHLKDGGHILVMRDITEKKQADEQKARFLSILSHELRTPLNGIKGFSEVILADTDFISAEYRDFIGLINDCGCQLEAIVDELLRFVQVFSEETEPMEADIRLDHLVSYVMDMLKEKMDQKQIKANVTVDGPDPVMYGKSEHLVEVLKQILDNAVKFGNENTDIHILLETGPENVTITCDDRGQGIPEDKVDRLFDSFFQVEDYNTRTQDGLGLGLTICKKIIESYNGTIHISNREGGGTRVKISLPRTHK